MKGVGRILRIRGRWLICIPALWALLLSGASAAGQVPAAYPPAVTAALALAADHGPELEKVLSHYASLSDSIGLQAAFYLIANMEGHGFVTYALRDTLGAEIPFNVLDYPDYQTLEAAFDSLEAQHGLLDFKKKEFVADLNAITADFLIGQIDYALKAWREKPWAQQLAFDQFCEYVLPYRGSEEPLESWREEFFEKYQDLESRMADPANPLEAARLINEDLKSWFHFDPRYYYHPTDQGLSEMLKARKGRCEDMTNLTIYALRANGLAVTSDYTPYWANSGNNHAWNAILTPGGKVIPFMGAEANPGEYRLANKLAKVYRKTFSRNKKNIAFQVDDPEKLPPYLSGKSYRDVTADYVPVMDVAIRLKREVPDTVDFAYLCVFNSGAWKAIQWGKITEGVADFSDMGLDVAYLPALYLNDDIVPAGSPFILTPDAVVQELLPLQGQTLSIGLASTTRREQAVSTDSIAQTSLTPGKESELFYWRDGWQSLGKSVAGDKPLIFENVPAGGLYWLVAAESDREERIFTIRDGRQVWW
jgi:hypothetical protein